MKTNLADIFTSHERKGTGGMNDINDGCINH